MILEQGKIKRAGIYLFFDKHGIADEYILNMIRDLKHNTDHMLVVCNGYVTSDSLIKLKSVSDDLICRANTGFDLGAYRDGILYLGYKELEKYDEIIFVNYTFFGPMVSFDRMFREMEPKDVDFWGITKHHKVDPDPFGIISYGFLPEHIQSHFIAVRRSLFMSYEYRDFVMNRTNPESYTEAICSYEAIFTKYFSDLDYRWAVYSDTSEYEQIAYYPLFSKTYDMITELNCPIIKRRSFFTNYEDFLYNTAGEPTKIAYDYIRESGIYDIDMLWDNLLRLENMTCLHRCVHLDYLTNPDYLGTVSEKGPVMCIAACPVEDIIFYKKALSCSAAAFSEIHIFGSDEEYEALRNCIGSSGSMDHAGAYGSYSDFIKKAAGISGNDVNVLILDLSAGEDDRHERIMMKTSDLSHLAMNSNSVYHAEYHFRENRRLGLLVPPLSSGCSGIKKYRQQWLGKYDEVKKIMKDVTPSLNFPADENPLYPAGGSFWIRGEMLKRFADEISPEEDGSIVRLTLSLYVQHFGQYTGRIYNTKKYPKVYEEQINVLRDSNKTLFTLYGPDIHVSTKFKIMNDEVIAN